jgi:hypothetical protein
MRRESELHDNSSSQNRVIAGPRTALLQRVLEGEGRAPRNLRRAAFESAVLSERLRTLTEKVVRQPTQISDGDFAAARAAGYSEDQLFELVVCAAIGAAESQLDGAMEALISAESPA